MRSRSFLNPLTPIALGTSLVAATVLTAHAEAPMQAPPASFSIEPYFQTDARSKVNQAEADIRSPRVGIDLTGTWLLPPRWRISVGAGIEHDHYRLFNFGLLIPGAAEPMRDAFRVRIAPVISYVVDERWAVVGGLTPEWSGDPDADIARSMTFGGFVGARRQFTPRFAMTFGGMASTRLADTPRFLPLVGVEWQISERWRFGTQGPGGRVSYDWRTAKEGKPLTAYLRMSYESREFRFAEDSSIPDGVLRDQAFPVGLGLEWQATPVAAVTLELGSSMSGSVRIRDRDDRTVLDRDLKSGSYLRVGVRMPLGSTPAADSATSSSITQGTTVEEAKLSGHVFSAWEENDSMTGTDANYSQGLQFSYLAPESEWGSMSKSIGWFGEGIPALGYQVERGRFAFSTGQVMYTPIDIHTTALQSLDRPYAGWIFFAPAVQRRGQTSSGNAVLEELKLNLGWMGPGALAGESQNFIHRNFAIGLAEGWTHQLHNEPTGDLTLARAWRHTLAGDRDGGCVEFIGHGAFTGGTPRTEGTLGGLIRIGVNLPDDFGQPTILSSLPHTAGVPRSFGVHLFAGIEGRATAYDSFVDGNLWRSSQSVAGRPVGLESRVGVAVTWHSVDLGFTYARQSPDFKGQPGGNHDYGSLWMNWRI